MRENSSVKRATSASVNEGTSRTRKRGVALRCVVFRSISNETHSCVFFFVVWFLLHSNGILWVCSRFASIVALSFALRRVCASNPPWRLLFFSRFSTQACTNLWGIRFMIAESQQTHSVGSQETSTFQLSTLLFCVRICRFASTTRANTSAKIVTSNYNIVCNCVRVWMSLCILHTHTRRHAHTRTHTRTQLKVKAWYLIWVGRDPAQNKEQQACVRVVTVRQGSIRNRTVASKHREKRPLQ